MSQQVGPSLSCQTLVPQRNRFIQVMLFQTAFSFSGVMQRLACSFSGLRLRALRQFSVFLATGSWVESATSYHFASVVPPRWRSVFSQFAPVVKVGVPVRPESVGILVVAVFHHRRDPKAWTVRIAG
ncbi:DUF1010 domain-containing protein [Alicycliphilus denitrificans]|uniref:DUF1010 domain-containing protein n=1 Tax=Alicycliphilus denitrificans TaxID=179636 RepID=UPI0038514C0D